MLRQYRIIQQLKGEVMVSLLSKQLSHAIKYLYTANILHNLKSTKSSGTSSSTLNAAQIRQLERLEKKHPLPNQFSDMEIKNWGNLVGINKLDALRVSI